jgi:hypothetical protein
VRQRYLGRKPGNWPAAVLFFGWVGFWFTYQAFGAGRVSRFAFDLPEAPLFWWAEMSGPGFFLTMSPIVLSALAYWLLPRTDWSARVGGVLVGAGALLFMCGVVWDSGSGVALYPDRVVTRASGFGQKFESDRFATVWRVEAACHSGRRGRADPSYVLWFVDGRPIDIMADSAMFPSRARMMRLLDAVLVANAAVDGIGVPRAPQRNRDGRTLGSAQCVDDVANALNVPRDKVQPLFIVHQAQLRPDEYVVVPSE